MLNTNNMKNQIKWDGNASMANKHFGDSYGNDWTYESKESSNIIVNGKLIKNGDLI